MITLYTWGTPNGRKATIMLEELGADYRIHPVNIGKDEQFDPEYLKISPNNKIPAIVDEDADGGPLPLFESGAILIYLADKYGRFLPERGADRYSTLQWLMWQMGGLGPMFGQLGWFTLSAPEPNPVGQDRYRKEADRLLGVLDKRLSESRHVGHEEYSIADIAIYPWITQYRTRIKDQIEPLLQKRPFVLSWLDRVGERPAVQKGMLLP